MNENMVFEFYKIMLFCILKDNSQCSAKDYIIIFALTQIKAKIQLFTNVKTVKQPKKYKYKYK